MKRLGEQGDLTEGTSVEVFLTIVVKMAHSRRGRQKWKAFLMP